MISWISGDAAGGRAEAVFCFGTVLVFVELVFGFDFFVVIYLTTIGDADFGHLEDEYC